VYLKIDGELVGETVKYEVEKNKEYFFEGSGDAAITGIAIYVNGENNLVKGLNPVLEWTPKEEKEYELDIIGFKEEAIVTSQKFYLTGKNKTNKTKPKFPEFDTKTFLSECNYLREQQTTMIYGFEDINIKIGFAYDNQYLPGSYYGNSILGKDFVLVYDEKINRVIIYYRAGTDPLKIKSEVDKHKFAFDNHPCAGFYYLLRDRQKQQMI
jgi:hypothetical protein